MAMVRLLLNLAVRRPEDAVDLVPPTIGFGAGGGASEEEERAELWKLLEGCHPVGEPGDALEAFRVLKNLEIEELLDKVHIPAEEFCDYYPHFLILLVLDFMEELAQNQEGLARIPESLMAAGRLVPNMATEISDDGKSLVCLKVGVRKSASQVLKTRLSHAREYRHAKSSIQAHMRACICMLHMYAGMRSFGRCLVGGFALCIFTL